VQHLSVSSIGTNELQLFNGFNVWLGVGAFSFLYRNERTATYMTQYLANLLVPFSFLYRNERTATYGFSQGIVTADQSFSFLYRNERTATPIHAVNGQPFVRIFQFPLSERTNCNLDCPYGAVGDHLSFSFLYRNERTATRNWFSACAIRMPFSFLYRNERTATQ